MEISESIQRVKSLIEENGLNIDRSSKAVHWMYRSSDRIPGYTEDTIIRNISQMKKRDLNRLCDDLSAIRETIGNLEKIVMNELNYREFGTAEHTRDWW